MLTAKQKNIMGVFFLVLGIAYAISPFFKGSSFRHVDARFFYVAGACWLSGKSPYNSDVYGDVWKENMKNEENNYRKEKPKRVGGSSYPPSLAIYTMPSAFFAWETGKYYYDFMNVIFLLAIIFFLTRLIKDLPSIRADFGKIGLVVGLGCLFSAVPATISQGQTTLLALTGCLGAFYFSERGRFFVAGLFVVLASVKPHFSLLFIMFLFITQKNWRFFCWSSLLVGITFLGILIQGGDLNPVPEYLVNVSRYTAGHLANNPFNLPGLTRLTADLGISRATLILLGLAVVTTLALWFRRMSTAPNNQETSETWVNHKKEQDILAMALIFSVTALFMPLHYYDHTLFFTVVILLVVVRWNLAWWLILGIILVARPHNLGDVLAHVTEMLVPGVFLASLGIVYLTLTIAIIIWKLRSEALEAIQLNQEYRCEHGYQ